MSDSDRPGTGPHDEDGPSAAPEGMEHAVAGDAGGPEEDLVVVEAGADEGERPARRRVPWSPWWRLAAAAVAVGGLTWGVTATDATMHLTGDPRADASAVTADPGAGTFVESAVLACPGPVPWLGGAAEDRPRVEVLAAGAPQSVLDTAPPAAAGETSDAVPDDAAVTDAAAATAAPPASDPATATSAPDAAGVTSAPDAAGVTSAPDPAAATSSPDVAGATSGPDAAATTARPDDAATTAEAPGVDAPAPDDSSLLRSTVADGPSAELHGIPAGFVLEEPAAAVVQAAGTTAPGVAGGQLGLGTEPGSRGLTLSGCVAAGEVQWLVGGGSAAGRSEQLVLTNPGPDAVTVEVSVWGSDGPVDTTGASGIVVPGGGRVVELLDAVAPGVDAPVVSIAATGGPVVAHLAESFREGTTDRGTEVILPVTAPVTDLVVPALPAAPEGHERQVVLRVAAPGEVQAVVDLTALTAEGAVRLTDQVTRVEGGHTVDVELGDLPEGATALRLRSDEPVTAGARLEVLPAEGEPEIVEEPGAADAAPDPASATAEPGAEAVDQDEPLLRAAGDVAWVGATVPRAIPTGMALPDRAAVPAGTASLALSAVDGTTARVSWVDEQGAESSQVVELPNDTTALVDVPAEARAVWVVGAGPAGVVSAVHVAGADDRGPFVAAATVPDLPWLRHVTQVRPAVP